MMLAAMEDLSVAQGDALMDEGLAHEVVGGVVAILGGDGRLIDCGNAKVGFADDMPLDELHSLSPRLFLRHQRSAVW
jgi:hypothetical protein